MSWLLFQNFFLFPLILNTLKEFILNPLEGSNLNPAQIPKGFRSDLPLVCRGSKRETVCSKPCLN
jgi:hypothetical protein